MGDIFIEIDGKAVPVAVVWVHLQGTNSNGSDCTIVVPAAFLKDVFDPTGGGWYDLGSVTLGTGVSPSSLVLSYTTISAGNHAPDLICVGYAAQAVYDAAQETTETIDADGRASVILYNGIGQETGENWYTTTTTTGTAAESLGWTYNVAGLMQTASDQNIAAGTSVAEDYFSYDAEGRETSESQEVPGLTTLVAVTDQYTAGNRTELSADVGGTPDFVNNYDYTFSASDNPYGQMSQVTQSGQYGGNAVADKTVTFSYLADGQFSSIARYASPDTSSGLVATSSYGYNAAGQTTSLTHTAADLATYAAYTWTYNASGEVASFSNGATIADYSAEDIGSLAYDATGQLTGATPPTGTSDNAENYLSNAYDDNGNATTLNGVATAVGPDNTLASDGAYTDTYDADGNLVEQSNSTTQIFYAYDNRNRLTSVVTQVYSGCEWSTTSSINYVYDAFNNLVARTGSLRATPPALWVSVFSQFFAYDGANQVLALGADGSVTDRYLWGPGVNQLLADDNYALGLSSPTLWTLGDNQNSIRDLVSSDGTLQQHIAYSPFGQQIVTAAGAFSTEAVCVFGYTGSFTDVVTGDVLNGVRWYDPASERWLTQDPAAADENLYRYCGNAPTDGTDPTGCALIEEVLTEALKTALELGHNSESTNTLKEQQEKAVDSTLAQFITTDVNDQADPDLKGKKCMTLKGTITIPTTPQKGGGAANVGLSLAGTMGFDTDAMTNRIKQLQAAGQTVTINNKQVAVTITNFGQTASLRYTAIWDPDTNRFCSAFWAYQLSYWIDAKRADTGATVRVEVPVYRAHGTVNLNH